MVNSRFLMLNDVMMTPGSHNYDEGSGENENLMLLPEGSGASNTGMRQVLHDAIMIEPITSSEYEEDHNYESIYEEELIKTPNLNEIWGG